jgi:DNA-binding winged helix-turn-helix (wHTH) protein
LFLHDFRKVILYAKERLRPYHRLLERPIAMPEPQTARRYRFGTFEADPSSGELRRQGLRIKIKGQPFQLLLLLLERSGQVVTREEISRNLWPEGTFVDFDHGVNSAINRIREALGDSAGNPRFIETLARRGYRFIAPVEQVDALPEPPKPETEPSADKETEPPPPRLRPASPDEYIPLRGSSFLAEPHELPKVAPPIAALLFLLLQAMYLGFYVSALANLGEIEDLVSVLPWPVVTLDTIIISAAILIPIRAFVSCAVLFRPPAFRERYLRLWPAILVLDVLWSLAPFLLLHHINFGLAIACTAILVYSPFAQRSLVLMGAGTVAPPENNTRA